MRHDLRHCAGGARGQRLQLTISAATAFRQAASLRRADRSGQPSGCRDRYGPGFDHRPRPRPYRIAGALRLVRVTTRRFTPAGLPWTTTIKVPVILTTDGGIATSARPVGPGKGTAAALPNDAMKIVARGADKEDQAAARHPFHGTFLAMAD